MCIEDIAIARRCYVRTTSFSSNTAHHIKPDPDRLSVRVEFVFGSGGDTVIAAGRHASQPTTAMIAVRENVAGLNDMFSECQMSLSYDRDGPIVQGEMTVYSSGGDGKVHEVIMQPELAQLIRDKLNNWKR